MVSPRFKPGDIITLTNIEGGRWLVADNSGGCYTFRYVDNTGRLCDPLRDSTGYTWTDINCKLAESPVEAPW
jgi:hypothetical protein